MFRRPLSPTICLVAFALLFLSHSAHAQNLIVSEYFNNRAYEVAPDGTKKLFCSSSGTTRFDSMSFDNQGYLYIATQGSSVRRFSPTGQDLGNFVTSGLNNAIDAVFDRNGNLYVSNFYGDTVTRFSPTGASLGVFANVSRAYNMAFDSSGNLYVGSYSEGKIYRFSPTGQPLGAFASGLSIPSGLAFDKAGNLYVVNRGKNTVHRFSSTGADLGVFASTGLSDPRTIAFDSNGNLYVANSGGSTVRRFSPTGTDLGNFVTGLATPTGLAFRPPRISGKITFKDISTLAKPQTITFTFRPQDGSGDVVRTASVPYTGEFEGIVVPANKYTLHIKGTKYLAQNIPVDASNGDVSGVTATLLPGDANDDNNIDIFDLATLAEAFNSQAGDSNWNANADFNGNGEVSIFDLGILAEYFNTEGDP